MSKKFFTQLISEIRNNLLIYIPLFAVLIVGFYIRIYRVDELLGFYYDQGRDALVVWDIWHKGDIPFIGPTTGIAGIFRGPFYYYLIAPFYLLGGGDPLYPTIFLAFLSTLAILLIYYLGFKVQDRVTGLIAAILASFSFNIVMASRWLSNPTPMLLLSLLLVWMMILVAEGKRWAWAGIAFLFGLSLFHFGSSGEFFYLPAIVVFAIWQHRCFPGKRELVISCCLFLIAVLPLVAFDIKNNGLLIGNIKNFLFAKESFGAPSWKNIGDKVDFLYDVFTNKIFNGRYVKERALLAFILLFFVYHLHKLVKNKGIKILFLVLSVGSLGIIFFQGNFGNIYDYYLTGYYLPFILLFAVALGYMWRFRLGKIFIIYFMYLFLTNNADVLKFKLTDPANGPISINFGLQKKAIEWIYADVESSEFNVDVYVPPVIPYAYDYLLKWYPTTPGLRETRGKSVEKQVPLLYTLYEQDPPNPDRLDTWLARQKGIGKVEESQRFGGITVERRTRLE